MSEKSNQHESVSYHMSLWWPQKSLISTSPSVRHVFVVTSGKWGSAHVYRLYNSEKSGSAQVSGLYVSLWWPQKSLDQHKSLGYTCLCGDLRKVDQHKSLGYTCLCGDLRKVWISTSLWVIRVFVVTSAKSGSAQVSRLYLSLWWPQKSLNQHKFLGYTCLCGDLRKVWISTRLAAGQAQDEGMSRGVFILKVFISDVEVGGGGGVVFDVAVLKGGGGGGIPYWGGCAEGWGVYIRFEGWGCVDFWCGSAEERDICVCSFLMWKWWREGYLSVFIFEVEALKGGVCIHFEGWGVFIFDVEVLKGRRGIHFWCGSAEGWVGAIHFWCGSAEGEKGYSFLMWKCWRVGGCDSFLMWKCWRGEGVFIFDVEVLKGGWVRFIFDVEVLKGRRGIHFWCGSAEGWVGAIHFWCGSAEGEKGYSFLMWKCWRGGGGTLYPEKGHVVVKVTCLVVNMDIVCCCPESGTCCGCQIILLLSRKQDMSWLSKWLV